jgi:hypothetical protein
LAGTALRAFAHPTLAIVDAAAGPKFLHFTADMRVLSHRCLDGGGFFAGLSFFFEAAFADFFGVFTLPPTKMIMICSSAKL